MTPKARPLYKLGMVPEWVKYVRKQLDKAPGGEIYYKREHAARDPLFRKVQKEGKRTHSWRQAETRVYQGKPYVLLREEAFHWVAWRS